MAVVATLNPSRTRQPDCPQSEGSLSASESQTSQVINRVLATGRGVLVTNRADTAVVFPDSLHEYLLPLQNLQLCDQCQSTITKPWLLQSPAGSTQQLSLICHRSIVRIKHHTGHNGMQVWDAQRHAAARTIQAAWRGLVQRRKFAQRNPDRARRDLVGGFVWGGGWGAANKQDFSITLDSLWVSTPDVRAWQ
jgi:hypothetical protein